jgi:hypothetical protein
MTATEPSAGSLQPERERVHYAPVLRRAAHTFRRHPRRVIGIAAILAVPMTVVEAIVYEVSNLELSDSWKTWLTVQAIVVIGTISTVFFWEFYAGLLDRVCLEDQHGHSRYGLAETFKTLPYLRLMLASFIVWGLYLVLGAIGEVPAMVALSFFAIAGPIVNSEGQPVFAALRRSAKLVRHAFWVTTVLITVPLVAEAWIAWAVEDALHGQSQALVICVEVVIVMILTPIIGVVEVTLAHELMRRDPLPGEAGAIWLDSPLNDDAVMPAPDEGIAVLEADVPGASEPGGPDGGEWSPTRADA